MLALSRDDVRSLVTMRTAIDLMKQVFIELSAGRAESPLRTPLEVPKASGVSLFMPAFVPAVEGLGLKIVSVFPRNRDSGKPTIHAIVVLVSSETGEPLAILDGTFLTALRTGAVSGAATELLARPDSRVLTCIGAGAQGITQAWAVATVRDIERIYVHDLSPESAASFAVRLGEYAPELESRVMVAGDLDQALRQSDVVCTATTSRKPVFNDQSIRPGTHINGVGAFTPEMQEIPAETVRRSLVVVDATDAALAEAGDLIMPLRDGLVSRAHFGRELGQLAAGDVTGRTDEQQITFFKSVGNAVQDIIVAREAVNRASSGGIGQQFSL